jgi:hypothetical protein
MVWNCLALPIKPRLVSAFFMAALCLSAAFVIGQESGLPKIVPPKIEGGKKSVKLPGTVNDICVGGGGKYLLLHMKELRKIAVFDVNTLMIKGYIAAGDDDTKFTASAKKAFLISASKGVISRWDLESLERELTKSIDTSGNQVRSFLMGSAANSGPLVIGIGDPRGFGGEILEVDSETLTSSGQVGKDHNAMKRSLNQFARISANGKTISGNDPFSMTRIGSEWTYKFAHEISGNQGNSTKQPTADGRYILAGNGVYTRDLKPVGEVQQRQNSRFRNLQVAGTSGPFYLELPMVEERSRRSSRDETPQDAKLMMVGESIALSTIPSLEPVTFSYRNRNNDDSLANDKQVFFIPDANLVIQVSPNFDSLNCIGFDVELALNEADFEFLVVTSRPNENLKVNEAFQYQIEARASSDKFSYKLESAPQGMSISDKGLVSWTPTTSSPAKNSVIVSISVSDDETTFHNFQLSVAGAKGQLSATSTANATVAPNVEETEINDDQLKIKLPCSYTQMVVGGSGRYLLLHLEELMKIAVVDISQGKIVNYIPANDASTLFAASQDKLIVFGNDQGVVSRWNLATQERELTVNSPFGGKISSIAMGAGSRGPAMVFRTSGSFQSGIAFLDLDTLGEFKVDWENNNRPSPSFNGFNQTHASNRGSYFTVPGCGPIHLNGNKIKFGWDRNQGTYLPSADGRYFFQQGRQYNFEMQTTSGDTNFGTVVPAVAGDFFLGFNSTSNSRNGRNSTTILSPRLYMYGESRSIVNLPKLKLAVQANGMGGVSYQYAGLQNRVCFVPDAKAVVISDPTLESLTIHRLDLDQALEDSGVDYLLVTSRPEPEVKFGQAFSYPMVVKSKNGGLKFNLESGPKGMLVDQQGNVTWQVPNTLDLAKHSAIISVKDNKDQEVFHTIALEAPEVLVKLAKLEKEKRDKEQAVEAARRAEHQAEMVLRNTKRREAEMARRAETERRRTAALTPLTFESREWTDNTGEHTIVATFLQIENKTSVILKDANGKKKTIPLQKLAPEDMYHAVECDLKLKRHQNSGSQKGESPFAPKVDEIMFDELSPPVEYDDGTSRTILLDAGELPMTDLDLKDLKLPQFETLEKEKEITPGKKR